MHWFIMILHRRASHVATLFRAGNAGFCATLAMVVRMLAAFDAARVANVGADLAKFAGKMRSVTHERCGCPTDRGAISVEPNAFGHHLHVMLAQAGRGAMFTFHCAPDTRFDARLVFLVRHDFPLSRLKYSKSQSLEDLEAIIVPFRW